MDTRGALAGAMVVAGLAGCATPPAAVGTQTAQVLVDGSGTTAPVTCSQTGWTWFIESLDEESGFTAVLKSGTSPEAQSVQIQDVGGFTGAFWAYTVGSGDASVERGVFTVTGEAEGYFADSPNDRVTVQYRLAADC